MSIRLKTALIVSLVAACGYLYAEDESALWWMFDETTEIQEIGGGTCTIDQLVGRGDAEGLTVNGIRVAAYNGDTLLGYLSIADGGESPTFMDYYPMPTTDFDSGADTWSGGPTYAQLGSYATATPPGVSFVIELGNWDASQPAGQEWQILAHSDSGTMTSLREFIDVTDFEMHTTLEWTGGHYSVPEPSSGLLLLIGGALLALRRRHS